MDQHLLLHPKRHLQAVDWSNIAQAESYFASVHACRANSTGEGVVLVAGLVLQTSTCAGSCRRISDNRINHLYAQELIIKASVLVLSACAHLVPEAVYSALRQLADLRKVLRLCGRVSKRVGQLVGGQPEQVAHQRTIRAWT